MQGRWQILSYDRELNMIFCVAITIMPGIVINSNPFDAKLCSVIVRAKKLKDQNRFLYSKIYPAQCRYVIKGKHSINK